MAMTGGTAKLVSRGTPPGWSGPVSLYVYYKEKSQSQDENKTILSLGMYVTTPTGWSIGDWTDFNGSYIGTAANGEYCRTFNGSIPNFTGTRWLVENVEFPVAHEADGSKNVTIHWHWGVNSVWSGVMNNPSGSFQVALTQIPRGASLDSVSCSTNKMDGTILLRYTPRNPEHYHLLRIELDVDGERTPVRETILGRLTAAQQSMTVVLTEGERSAIYEALPDSASGCLVATILTFQDEAYANPVGEGSSGELTLVIPEDGTTRPVVSLELEPDGNLPGALEGIYIQGKTKIRGRVLAEGKYLSEIVARTAKVEAVTYGADDGFLTDYLGRPGIVTVTGQARDSRGFVGTAEATVTVLPYSDPRILPVDGEGYVAARCDSEGKPSDSGIWLMIKARREYSSLDGRNQCAIRYRYRAENAQGWSEWTTILAGGDSGNEVSSGPMLGTLSVQNAWVVQVQAMDLVGGYAESTVILPPERVYWHRDGARNALGLGKYAEGENLLDCAWDAHFHGEIRVGKDGMTLRDYILAVMSEGE